MKPILRVIVLDGFDWPWLLANRDATAPLWRLAEQGFHARLEAPDPPVTSTAVATLLSGHTDEVPWVQGDRFSTSQELIRTRPWFGALAALGMSTAVCNVPLTWPAFPMPAGGWVVSGFPVDASTLLPESRHPWRWPPALPVSDYPIGAIVADHGAGGTKDLEGLARAEDVLVDWFLRRPPRCDVEVIWLRSTDSAGHHAWGTDRYRDTCARACGLADRLASDALRSGASILVLSDHGFDALSSERCASYRASEHGRPAAAAGLQGGHARDGILFGTGPRISRRGRIEDQRLLDVATGILDLLQVPPPPGMPIGSPSWSKATTPEEDEAIRRQLADLGYI